MKHGIKIKWLALLLLPLAAISFTGCMAAIPLVVHYYSTDENYVATAEVKKDADEVWRTVLRLSEEAEKEGRIEILKKDDSKRLLKGTDGNQIAEVKVLKEGKKESQIIITTTLPKGDQKSLDRSRELAARIMKRLCEEAKAECKLAEE